MCFGDIKLVMKHFGVKEPSQLVGNFFESDKDTAWPALEDFLTSISQARCVDQLVYS